jgi:hypothetical protein
MFKKILIVLAIFIFSAIIVSAAIGGGTIPGGSNSVTIVNPLKANSFTELIDRVMGYALEVATALLVLMILVSAFQLLSAAGNTEKISVAKKTIFYSVIGYVIILIAKGLTSIISDVLGVG